MNLDLRFDTSQDLENEPISIMNQSKWASIAKLHIAPL